MPQSTPKPSNDTYQPVPETKVDVPQSLRITSLQINAPVRAVGLTAEGDMDAPTNLEDVAWYQHGPFPGRPGNAVIAGHAGVLQPGVFANLADLQVGATVEITDKQNQIIRFKVTGSRMFDPETTQLEEIFGPTNKTRLNLITCEGEWNQHRRTYTKRLVVFTEAVQ